MFHVPSDDHKPGLDLGTVLPTKEERTPAGFAALIKRDADKLTPALSAAPKQ